MPQKPFQPPTRRLEQKLLNHILVRVARLFFWSYGRWKVIGLENIPRTGSLLLAANHASYLDPLLIWAATYGHRTGWGIARDDLWKNRLVGYLLDSIKVFPVKRGTADRAALRRALYHLGRGEGVAIFPEGTRTRDGLLLPAQPGIALLAQKSGAPIIPCAIIGTYEMLPSGRSSIRHGPLKVIFGAPMAFDKAVNREEVTTRVMQSIADLLSANGRPTAPPIAGAGNAEAD